MKKPAPQPCCPPEDPAPDLRPVDGPGADAELGLLLKALAHPARITIVRLLARRNACICGEIVDEMPLAQSTVYDTLLTLRVRQPDAELLDVAGPVTVLRGAQTFPFLIGSSDRLAAEIPGAELVIVPESVMHRPDPAATARVIADRL